MDLFWANNWQWLVPLIVGAVALILAISPALAMMFGQPKINIKVGNTTIIENSTIWQYDIENTPIRSRFLRRIGVRRMTAEGVISYCSVTDYQDKAKSYKMVAKIQDYEGGLKQRVNIPSGVFSVTVSFLVIKQSGNVHFMDNDFTQLGEGGYILDVFVAIEGRRYHTVKFFLVTREDPYCIWIENEQKTK